MAKSQQEAELWEQLENDAAKHYREALDCMIQAAAEAVEFVVIKYMCIYSHISYKREKN